jgi:transcriptional regulator with XRE-family HTH domain
LSSKHGNNRTAPRGPILAWQDGMRAATGMRRLRLEADLTQEALGSLAGHSQQGIGQREQGAVRMTRGEAKLIAKALGTDLEGLLAAGWNPAEPRVREEIERLGNGGQS